MALHQIPPIQLLSVLLRQFWGMHNFIGVLLAQTLGIGCMTPPAQWELQLLKVTQREPGNRQLTKPSLKESTAILSSGSHSASVTSGCFCCAHHTFCKASHPNSRKSKTKKGLRRLSNLTWFYWSPMLVYFKIFIICPENNILSQYIIW